MTTSASQPPRAATALTQAVDDTAADATDECITAEPPVELGPLEDKSNTAGLDSLVHPHSLMYPDPCECARMYTSRLDPQVGLQLTRTPPPLVRHHRRSYLLLSIRNTPHCKCSTHPRHTSSHWHTQGPYLPGHPQRRGPRSVVHAAVQSRRESRDWAVV